MDINNLLTSDAELKVIDEGTWVGDLEGAPDLEVFVTGFGTKKVQSLMEKKQAAARSNNRRGKPLSMEQYSRITGEVLAEVVLKDWKGLKDNGKEVKYSKDLATKWLTSRNGAKFADVILKAAQRVDDEAKEFVEEVSKNSKPD